MAVKIKNKRLRFTHGDDVIFLLEVVAQNPITCSENWEVVQQNLGKLIRKKCIIRTLKQHLQLLLEIWEKKEILCKIQ